MPIHDTFKQWMVLIVFGVHVLSRQFWKRSNNEPRDALFSLDQQLPPHSTHGRRWSYCRSFRRSLYSSKAEEIQDLAGW